MLHTDNEAFIWANLLWESGNLPLELRRKTSRRNLLIVGVRTRERDGPIKCGRSSVSLW